MNSPRNPARTPARLDRSISPQPLDLNSDTVNTYSPTAPSTFSRHTLKTSGKFQFPVFSRLPSKVIQRILWSVDANGFASLCILNRQWRRESQKVELYAHHLSRCPSYALSNSLITGPFRRNDLSRLKAKFAAEVRRNLFDAYLRPRRTLINLISINANSSAAFPAGEAFRFEFSPNGRTILALSSSRIYVLDATTEFITVKRRLKTLRRPRSASVTDDGSLLAVLSSKHQVNIYALTPHGVQHLQVIALDNPPKIIAIAHEGTVLAASYETGIEVFSLAANSLTTDRRAVRSESVDTLGFSGDGSMLIGSSLSLEDPNAVAISAPFYTENDPDLSPREMHSRMWTTQILFPQISSVCSHVVLLPGHLEGDASWLFAFDHSLMSYRAVRTDDTRSGVAYFLSPPGADRFDTPIPTFAPAATACGTLAVAGFEEEGLCIYGIPERLDLSPDMGAVIERNERRVRDRLPLTSATGNAEPLMAYSPTYSSSDNPIEDDSLASKVDWRQSLFVKCKNIEGLSGQTAAQWVEHIDAFNARSNKRLVVVAPGGISSVEDELGDETVPVDGSRMCVLDFDYVPSTPVDRTITIEVGEEEPEILTEHTGSLANEVAMERRRTIRAIPIMEGVRAPLGRSVTSISPPASLIHEDGIRRGSISSPSSPTEQSRSPRLYATNSLHRSATASGFRHALYPPRPPLGSVQSTDRHNGPRRRSGQYGRPTSQDSWETPPPPYTGANGTNVSAHHTPYGNIPNLNQAAAVQASGMSHDMLNMPTPHAYRPYRPPLLEQPTPTIDAAMSSNAFPSGGIMSHYDELALAATARGQSDTSLNTTTEPSVFGLSPNNTHSENRRSYIAPAHAGPLQIRPATHHGSMQYEQLDRNMSMNLSISPTSPVDAGQAWTKRSSINSLAAAQPNGISLTGANLQNRLNHPVPPIPEQEPEINLPTNAHGNRAVQTSPLPPQHGGEEQVYPAMPTPNQMANLHRRVSQSELPRPPAIINTNFVHNPSIRGTTPTSAPGPVPASTQSPPRGAWGAAGVPGSPTFHQARNIPNGYVISRSSSRGSETSALASASAPNLLAQRPKYGRLDTIDSITDVTRPRETSFNRMSRAHSMTQAVMLANAEPSAYYETSRSGPAPGSASTKQGKKPKKRKDETRQKGTRCVIM